VADTSDSRQLFSPDLLTITDLRTRLQVSRSTVYKLIASGALMPIYLDDRPRFRPEDVERLLTERSRR
jgi:predicted site-specific integrase-resolvase